MLNGFPRNDVGISKFQILLDAPTIRWDLGQGHGRVTLYGARTLANPTNMIPGHYFLCVVQDSTGSRTLTYPATFKFTSNIPPTLSTGHDREDILSFECDGTYLFFVGIVKHVMNTTPDPGYSDNIVLWFSADEEAYVDNGTTLAVNNDTVYRWGDRSDNLFDAIQATASYRPTFKTNIVNSLPVIRFDGVDNVLPIPSSLAGTGDNLSFFIVAIPDGTSPIGMFDSGDEDSIRQFDSGQWDWFSGSPYTSVSLANTNPVLLEFIHTMAPNRSVTFYKNGTYVDVQNTSDSSTTLWENLAALGAINFGYAFYDGDMAEFILFKEALSTTNRQAVETYLKTKYGIT